MGSSCGGIWQVPWDENETCGLDGESCMTVQGRPLHLLSEARIPPCLKVREPGARCGSGFIIIILLVLPGGQVCAWRSPGPLCTAAAPVSFFLNLPFIEQPLCASSVLGAFHTVSGDLCHSQRCQPRSFLFSIAVPKPPSYLPTKMTLAFTLGSLPPYCSQQLLSEVHVPSWGIHEPQNKAETP